MESRGSGTNFDRSAACMDLSVLQILSIGKCLDDGLFDYLTEAGMHSLKTFKLVGQETQVALEQRGRPSEGYLETMNHQSLPSLSCMSWRNWYPEVGLSLFMNCHGSSLVEL